MIPDAVIERFDRSEQGWFGAIVARGLKLFTGELPYQGNLPNISSIPGGRVYREVWTWSPRFRRYMYVLLDTSPRAGVRMHSANFMGMPGKFRAQLNGCIALGERLGWMDGQKALLLSAPAVRRFESYMGHRPFLLEIRA